MVKIGKVKFLRAIRLQAHINTSLLTNVLMSWTEMGQNLISLKVQVRPIQHSKDINKQTLLREGLLQLERTIYLSGSPKNVARI